MTTTASADHPVVIEARLDRPLHRWLWLVKWFLAIPHLFILLFLWIAFVAVTIVAGFSIAFTGRYPRGLFDFNVGVLRWSYRVHLYAFVLSTDRYPPFSLTPDPDYPGDIDIAYPEHLSQGLVWIKWWLLAIPHYIIIGFFTGGGQAVGGLTAILGLVAGVTIAVRRDYPDSIFDFIMGMYRWTLRVIAYAALMRDEYPPFRLDVGPDEPGPQPAASARPPQLPLPA